MGRRRRRGRPKVPYGFEARMELCRSLIREETIHPAFLSVPRIVSILNCRLGSVDVYTYDNSRYLSPVCSFFGPFGENAQNRECHIAFVIEPGCAGERDYDARPFFGDDLPVFGRRGTQQSRQKKEERQTGPKKNQIDDNEKQPLT